MDKIKEFIINIFYAGMIGFTIALLELILWNPNKNILTSGIIYFVFSAVISIISRSSYSLAKYKKLSTLKAYISSMFANGISVFVLLVFILRTHKSYGWNAVILIILVTQVLALIISYFENRFYKKINTSLKDKKEELKRR